MTEEKMDATTAKLKALLDAGNIDLKNPETVKAFLRIPATVAAKAAAGSAICIRMPRSAVLTLLRLLMKRRWG